jgi:hypothetical protein
MSKEEVLSDIDASYIGKRAVDSTRKGMNCSGMYGGNAVHHLFLILPYFIGDMSGQMNETIDSWVAGREVHYSAVKCQGDR